MYFVSPLLSSLLNKGSFQVLLCWSEKLALNIFWIQRVTITDFISLRWFITVLPKISDSAVGGLCRRRWRFWLIINTAFIVNNFLNHNRTCIAFSFNLNITVRIFIILCFLTWFWYGHCHPFSKSWKSWYTWIKRLGSFRYGLSILFFSFLFFNSLFLLFKSIWSSNSS